MKKLFYLFVLITTISACKTKNKLSNSNNKMLTEVLNNYTKNSFKNNTLKAVLKIKYKGDKKVPALSASLRIEKDKVIWLSLSYSIFKVGKLKITPNSVKYYNKLDNTYFDGDFSLLSNLLGTEVNFKELQNILLGEAIYNLNNTDYQIKKDNNHFVFTPKSNNNLFTILFWLDSNSFKISKQEISQNEHSKLLSIQFTAFEKVADVNFIKHLYILAKDKETINTIDVDYKSVEFDLPLRFPFNIPNGYKEIKL